MQGGKGGVSIIREHEGGGRKDRDHGGGQGNRALDSDYRWQTSAGIRQVALRLPKGLKSCMPARFRVPWSAGGMEFRFFTPFRMTI